LEKNSNAQRLRPRFLCWRIRKGDREELARWHRFLPSGDTPEQKKVRSKLAERFHRMGGMTPELSKKITFGGE
jgi:hypothetical protein